MQHWKKLATLAIVSMFVVGSEAQLSPWKYRQPWTYPLSSSESRVQTCTAPTPLSRIAADDWICTRSGPITRVSWWGNVFHPAQGKRRYLVQIRLGSTAACIPGQVVYQTCVTPDYFKWTGRIDCRQQRVYFFSAKLVPIFTQQAGTRYWLTVAEDDSASIRVGLEDFRWSHHQPVKNCPAVQSNAAGGWTTPIFDPCNNIQTDLAFGVHNRGTIVHLAGRHPNNSIFRVNLYGSGGVQMDTLMGDPDDDGNMLLETDLPDGQYMVEIVGMSLVGLRRSVRLEEGMESIDSFFDIFYGDIDQNQMIDDSDLATVLTNFGR